MKMANHSDEKLMAWKNRENNIYTKRKDQNSGGITSSVNPPY